MLTETVSALRLPFDAVANTVALLCAGLFAHGRQGRVMTRRDLKRRALRASTQPSVRVVSDGCRDYLIEIVDGTSMRLLRRRNGEIERLRSLGEAQSLLRDCRVRRAVLRQRSVHDEELSGGASGGARFSDLPLTLTS